MSVHLSTLLKHYKQAGIWKEIFYNAEGRELAVRFDKGFGKRPDTLQYPSDVLEFAKKKTTSFHLSEEIWKNPMQLTTGMSAKELNALRIGWDLILDIDGLFEFSKIVAKHVINVLKAYKITSISCKFSGNKGFHIGVPFESFPKTVHEKPINELFPEAARRVAGFIWNKIEKKVADDILKKYPIEKLQEMMDMSFNELIVKRNGKNILNTKVLVDIDTVLISSRHLYRSVYSFNEKSGLISIPIKLDRVESFDKMEAKPENVRISKFRFLDRENAKVGEAKRLFEASYDWTFNENEFMKEEIDERIKKDMPKREYEADELAQAIPEEMFPPCIKKTLLGLKDGKKRSLFILINFLTTVGWNYEDIEEILEKWNQKNENSLKPGSIKSHIRYYKINKKKIMPPNCDNEGYYQNIGICVPDALCAKIKNPAQYSKIKFKNFEFNKPKEKKVKKEKKTKSDSPINKTDNKTKEQIDK